MADQEKPKFEIWDEERYRKKMYTLMARTNGGNALRRVRISEAMDYFYGRRINEEYSNLLTLHESLAGMEGNTPFARINFDSISPKIQLLLGELRERGFDISVNAVNVEAIKRKNIYERQMRFLMDMQGMYQGAQQYTGVPFGVNDNLPRNDDELAEYMESYRDLYETLMEEAVRFNLDLYKYRYLRKNLFLDLLITNEVHCKAEIRNGFPQFRRINPLNCVWDSGSEDDYQSDASFFMECFYMNIPDALEKFDIDERKMSELIKNYEEGGFSKFNGNNNVNGGVFQPFERGSGGGWNDTGYNRILILSAEWLDVDKITQKRVTDKSGQLHVHEYPGDNKHAKLRGKEKENPKNSVESKRRQIVRKATMIGGDYLTDYGVAENMVRDFSNPETTRLNYISVIHNYNGMELGNSLVNKLGALQDMKNYVLTVMQKEVTTQIGSLIAIDTSKIDTAIYGTGKDAIYKVLQNAKAYGLVAHNGAIDSMPDNALPFKTIEPKQQAIIRDAIMLAAYFDEEMEKISGIDKSRSGSVGERTLATVNSQRLMQSQFITDTYFVAFEGFETRLFETHVKQTGMAWVRNPHIYENVAARLGLVIPKDFDIDLQSYQCFVRTHPTSKRLLLQLAASAVEANALSMQDYLEIIMYTDRDLNRGIEKWLRLMRKREREQLEMQRQQMQAEQQAKQQAIEAQMRGAQQNTAMKADADKERQQMQEDGLNKRKMLELGVKEREAQNNYALTQDELRQRNQDA